MSYDDELRVETTTVQNSCASLSSDKISLAISLLFFINPSLERGLFFGFDLSLYARCKLVIFSISFAIGDGDCKGVVYRVDVYVAGLSVNPRITRV